MRNDFIHAEKLIQRQVARILQFALLVCAVHGLAQESIRLSETGALSSEARKPNNGPGHYFMKLGPVDFAAAASFGLEFNDNVGLSQNDRKADLILRPGVELDGAWHLTQLNTLRFNMGISYDAYMVHSDLDTRSILLAPGSELAFDVYVGGILKLTFHDRFAILQNPVDEPNLSNTARFDRFQNSAGVTALIDLNDLKFVLGYDHFDYRSLSSDFDFLDRREEQFYGSASLQLTDSLIAGLDGNGGLVHYLTDYNNDGYNWSAGTFLECTLSHYTTLRIAGGYQAMNFTQTGTSGDTSNFSGWYGSVTVAQRLNQYWTHSLSAGHEARLGLEVNYSEHTYVRYLAQWRINPRLTASLEAFAESANESGTAAQDSENAFRWGGSATLGWRLGSKLTAEIGYHYVNKNSDLPLRDYYQNVGTVLIKYNF